MRSICSTSHAYIERITFKKIKSGRRWLSHFRVIEHEVRAQHTREWPRGTEVGFENKLKLAVKQYVPYDQETTSLGDVTFIAAHANGFPKVSVQ
jgi:hypothetical protein